MCENNWFFKGEIRTVGCRKSDKKSKQKFKIINMATLGFLGKDRVSLPIEALYSMCDLILAPTKELENWLIVDGEVNSEIQKQFDKHHDEFMEKLKHFNCIGLHRKKCNEFWMFDGNTITIWILPSNGRSYELVFTKMNNESKSYNIWLDREIFVPIMSIYRKDDATAFIETGNDVLRFHSVFVGYYALNPFIIYEDLRTHGNGCNGVVLNKRKREENVIPLTINHHKYKIRNGVNVMNTDTGRIYPSIAETSRKLEYQYGMLWQLLKDNTIPPLKRIEKLNNRKL
jgi:hypothetical protein